MKPEVSFTEVFWCLRRMVGSIDVPAKGGFSFDMCRRNAMLEKKGFKVPGFRKTGTTIVGLVFAVCWIPLSWDLPDGGAHIKFHMPEK